jgi:hypothetical protein
MSFGLLGGGRNGLAEGFLLRRDGMLLGIVMARRKMPRGIDEVVTKLDAQIWQPTVHCTVAERCQL